MYHPDGYQRRVKKIGMEANNTSDVYEKGFEILFILFEKASEKKSEKALYEFIGTLLECSFEEVRDMDPFTLMTKLKEIADWEQWRSFFKLAVR